MNNSTTLSNIFRYTENEASVEEILEHFEKCSDLFNPPLSSLVNIVDYSSKIREYAYTFECWRDNTLIGLIACYLNDVESVNGFITNASVYKHFQGKGIASNLLSKAINKAYELGFLKIYLEVNSTNQTAINLYQRYGFIINNHIDNKYIMTKWLDATEIDISICCITYNHVNYIRQCLDGFLIQKCDFEYEILIHDDASEDGTADIIKEYEMKYPNRIKAIYQKENQYSKGTPIPFVYQFPRAKGKYIAMCEGDDYWTDPYKLQNQVDFLEANPEYSLCCHRYRFYDVEECIWEFDFGHKLFEQNKDGITFDNEFNLTQCWLTKTLTVIFRKEAIDFSVFDKYKLSRDTHLFYHLLTSGKGYCMNYIAAVCRKHNGGVHSKIPVKLRNKVAYNIYSELLFFNPDDQQLKSILPKCRKLYLNDIRLSYKNDKLSKSLFSETYNLLKNDYKHYGLRAVLYDIRKIIKSSL